MTEPIRISGFTGMNNVREAEGPAQSPRVLLNAVADQAGRLKKRDGYTKLITLTNGHSLWANDECVLCCDGNTIYRVNGTVKTSIGTISGAVQRLSAAELDGKVYLSNAYWNGAYDIEAGTVGVWGLSLPQEPNLLPSSSGSLPAGTYHVAFTRVSGREISGNGPVQSVTLSTTGGITILNRESDCIVWCTDPNGETLYLVGAVSAVTHEVSVEPLPTFLCSPPPKMRHIVTGFGRVWGASGDLVYYSEPFRPALFRLSNNFIQFGHNVTMIVPVAGGLFIHTASESHFLHGGKPSEMAVIKNGYGAIPGTLAWCTVLGDLGQHVPVWVSARGIMAGTQDGQIVNLTGQNVKFVPGDDGAALFRMKDGNPQIVTTFPKGQDSDAMSMGDSVAATVIRNGRVIAS